MRADIQPLNIVQAWGSGLTHAEIGEEYGCDAHTVRRILRDQDVWPFRLPPAPRRARGFPWTTHRHMGEVLQEKVEE